MFYEKNSGPGWQETESEGLSGLVVPLVEQTLSDSSTAAERRGGGNEDEDEDDGREEKQNFLLFLLLTW